MESPSLLVPLLCLVPDPAPCLVQPSNKILLGLFAFHYFNRAIIFPMRMRGGKPMPLSVMLSALVFCTWNGYLQGRQLTHLSCDEAPATDPSFTQPRFYIGVALFFIGWCANYNSDDILRNLRQPGETGYKIPYGGLFELVSGANFASETLEWIGFAVAANNLPAWTFAIFTFCNVGPRAVAHHRWYLEKFGDKYPAQRKAFIPFVW
jgi:3-oxo-5-alpha-steroid 4-dehydrogenase 1